MSYIMAGVSTLIGAFIVLSIHKSSSNRITVFGDDKIKNFLILCLPIVAFSIVGIENEIGINKSMYGLRLAIINSLYAFSEEFGWRKYLQNALEGLNKNFKYLLIAFTWWIWHFRFTTSFDLFVFPFICIGGGYLLGKLTDDFKSILPAVAMHNIIILTTNTGKFDVNQILGISLFLIGWTLIEYVWKRNTI